MVDKNRVEGLGHEIKGAVKEAAGKVTGDRETELAGKGEKVAGKAQGTVGSAKDSIKSAVKK